MALTVGGVAIDLSADAAQVVREMERASRATLAASQKMQGGLGGWSNSFRRVESGVQGFAGRVTRSLGGIGRVLPSLLGIGSLAGGASIAGLAALAKQSIDTASAIVDAADKAGIGTSAYQALSFQASQVGLSVEQLNTGLTTFATRVGQAQAGTGALSSTMKKLNPELAEALQHATSQEQALRIVADAMAQAATQTERLAIEQAAFGRGAAGAFTLALQGGGVAIDEFTQKARDMGLVLNEQLLRNAETAGDKLDVLAKVINTQLTGALIEAAPAIGELARQFAEAIPAIAAFARDAIAAVAPFFKELHQFIETTKQEWEALKKGWQSVAGFFSGTAVEVGGPAAERAGELGQGVPPGSGLSRIPTISGEAGRGGLSGGAGNDPLFGGSGSDRLQSGFIAPTSPRLIPPAAPKPEMFGPPTPDPGVLHEEQRGLEINRQLEDRQRLYDQLSASADLFASTVARGLTSAITGAQSFGEAMQGIIQSLAEAVIQALIFQAITAGIGSAGTATAGGGTTGGSGLLGAIFGGGRQHGGPVRAGSVYKVGESGRTEYFVPSVGGNILTQSQMAGASGGRGGGGNVINIDARQSTPGTVAAAVREAVRLAPGAVVNAQSRGHMGRRKAPW